MLQEWSCEKKLVLDKKVLGMFYNKTNKSSSLIKWPVTWDFKPVVELNSLISVQFGTDCNA